MSYQGWKNEDTWLVALHLDNDAVRQPKWVATAKRLLAQPIRGGIGMSTADAVGVLAVGLKAECDEHSPRGLREPYADMLAWSLDRVDWRAIAEGIIDTAKEAI